jgi:hypothetical protein
LGDLFGYAEGARDVGTGFARFFKSVGTGVVAGAATLVSAPIAGAREGGAKGFAAGLGLGLVGAVVLPVTGMVYGCAEVAKGAANTPGALKAQQADLEWDHDAKVSGRLRCGVVLTPPLHPHPPFFVVSEATSFRSNKHTAAGVAAAGVAAAAAAARAGRRRRRGW